MARPTLGSWARWNIDRYLSLEMKWLIRRLFTGLKPLSFFVVEQMLLILSLVLACLNHVFVLHVIVHQCRLVRRIRLLNDVMKLILLSFQMSKKTTSLVQVENYISWLTNQTPGVFILKSIEFYFSQKWSCRMTIYKEIYWIFHHKQLSSCDQR